MIQKYEIVNLKMDVKFRLNRQTACHGDIVKLARRQQKQTVTSVIKLEDEIRMVVPHCRDITIHPYACFLIS